MEALSFGSSILNCSTERLRGFVPYTSYLVIVFSQRSIKGLVTTLGSVKDFVLNQVKDGLSIELSIVPLLLFK